MCGIRAQLHPCVWEAASGENLRKLAERLRTERVSDDFGVAPRIWKSEMARDKIVHARARRRADPGARHFGAAGGRRREAAEKIAARYARR
jgi:hypothetical protein